MRIVCLSDTHNQHRRLVVPAGDLLIHAGDATEHGTLDELQDFLAWFGALPHRHKVFIGGNHDRSLQTDLDIVRLLIPDGVTYICDEAISVEGLNVYGTPWHPPCGDGAFGLPPAQLRAKWAAIPPDTDLLITHGPPAGVLDEAEGRLFGCAHLRARVASLDLAAHVFGHVHAAAGTMEIRDTLFVNAAVCDQQDQPVQPIQWMELAFGPQRPGT